MSDIFGTKGIHVARYAGLALLLEPAPTACAVGYKVWPPACGLDGVAMKKLQGTDKSVLFHVACSHHTRGKDFPMTRFSDDLMTRSHWVDLWQIDLSEPRDGIQGYRRLLSPDEAQRADRFHFEKHRRRFIVGRAAMRLILAQYTGLAPEKLVFAYGEKGKPELAGPAKESGIEFNLSNSSDLALLAVTHKLIVGVDIEWVNAEFASQEVAERFFSAGEVQCLLALPAADRTEAFFSCWTRKEAYIKALGEGLSVPLDSFEVAFGPGVEAALLQVAVAPGEVLRWSMYNLEAPKGFKAAVVVEGKQHQLRQMQWQP